MIRHLAAVQFTRFMTRGRTSPALCSCEDELGNPAGDYVLKLRGFVQETGSLREVLGNKLASHFDLLSPEPALITLEQALVNLMAGSDHSKAGIVNGSVGLNFGSKTVTGFSTWPVDKRIPDAVRQTAINIFAFDALVQNPDRMFSNPNLFTKGDDVIIYDHEIAFSFLLDILPSPNPWLLGHQQYLTNHVFYRQLKSQEIDLIGFTSHLRDLSDSILGQILAEVPPEWNNEDGHKIGRHLAIMRDHAEEFAEEVRRFLA
jgi:hypothetical protein